MAATGPFDRTNESADTMSGSDALLWTIGADPILRPTVVALVVLESTPEWSAVRDRIRGLTEAVPRLRARAVDRLPVVSRPRFVPDPAFDLADHVRRLRLPERGGLRDVLDVAQSMAGTGCDPALPLWEAVVVEGMEDGRAALLVKVHHAVIDGVGGLAVLAGLLDTAAPAGAPKEAAAASKTPEASHSPETPQHARDLSRAVELVDEGRDALFHPFRTLGRLRALGASVARLMAPAGRPVSSLMTGRGSRRHAEIVDVDLRALTDAAKTWGGTVNDVFMASVVRGLTLYHEQHGAACTGFRALMPINVRGRAGGAGGGNHFVPARFVVAAHADVAACVAEVRALAAGWKEAPGLAVSDVLATGLSTLPRPVARNLWGAMLRGTDVCVTNVPGPSGRTSIAGATVDGIYAFAPPSGGALNVSLVSSAGKACIGITVDAVAVPDSAKLAGCIEDGFAEVCSARPARPAGPAPG
jgi:diacylglycerol O-acyltransferase / wax synthase